MRNLPLLGSGVEFIDTYTRGLLKFKGLCLAQDRDERSLETPTHAGLNVSKFYYVHLYTLSICAATKEYLSPYDLYIAKLL